jgi:hypothetical protein
MNTHSLGVAVACFALGMALQALLMLRGRFRPGDGKQALIVIGISLVALLPHRRERHYSPVEHWFMVCVVAAVTFAAFFRKRLLPRIGGRILLAWNILLVFVVLRAGWMSPFLLVPLGIVTAFTVVNAFTDIDQDFRAKVFFHAWFSTILVVLAFRGMNMGPLRDFFAGEPTVVKWSPVELILTGGALLYIVTNAFFVAALIPVAGRGQKWAERQEQIRQHMELLASGYVWEKDDPVRSLAVIVVLPLVLFAIARWGRVNDGLLVSAAIAMMPTLAGRVPDAPEEKLPSKGPRFARKPHEKGRRG